MVSYTVKGHVLAWANREIVDGLKHLVRYAVEFKGRVKYNNSVLAQFARHAVSVHRCSGKRPDRNSLRQLSDSALAFEPIKHIADRAGQFLRSEEHTSELQSRFDLVCRLLLE